MSFQNYLFKIIIILWLFEVLNNFIVLPFETLFIKDQTINKSDYYSILFQNELYTNLSIGNPPQNVKSLFKMELSEFSLFEGAFNYNLSSTSEKGIWDINVNFLWHLVVYPVKDYFYFTSFNSYNDLEKYSNLKNINEKNEETTLFNIIKTNKTTFLIVPIPPYYSNINFYYFGRIGLRLYEKYYFDSLEFVIAFKNTTDI